MMFSGYGRLYDIDLYVSVEFGIGGKNTITRIIPKV